MGSPRRSACKSACGFERARSEVVGAWRHSSRSEVLGQARSERSTHPVRAQAIRSCCGRRSDSMSALNDHKYDTRDLDAVTLVVRHRCAPGEGVRRSPLCGGLRLESDLSDRIGRRIPSRRGSLRIPPCARRRGDSRAPMAPRRRHRTSPRHSPLRSSSSFLRRSEFRT